MSKRLPYYIDLPLFVFIILMCASAYITAHGTLAFYRYILPEDQARAAVIVLTGSIPFLELAAVLDKKGRPRYIIGLIILLAIETLAQYYQGQSQFYRNVMRQFAGMAGVDLATFAAEPYGRILPIIYLAMLPLIVVFFGYAASVRVRDLRINNTELDQLRNTLTTIQNQFATLTQDHATLQQSFVTEQSHRATLAQQIEEDRATRIPTRSFIIEYIKKELEQKASLHSIARSLNISESTLRHWLKEET